MNRAHSSWRSRLVQQVSRRVIKRHGLSDEEALRHLRRVFNNTPRVTIWPRGVRLRRENAAGLYGDHITTREPVLTVLYLHGGGFVAGRTRTYHNFAGRLAVATRGEVFLPRYPFAPEAPFPAAHNRTLEAYEHLLGTGRDPSAIVIAGDSAGGGLTLSTLLAIRDRGLPQPRCAVAISPGANAAPCETELKVRCPRDTMLSADLVRAAIRYYVPDEADRTHRYASPCDADFTGLAPLMITVSSDEILYGDAVRVRRSAERAGVPVRWLERPGALHVWPVLVPFLPEANRDLREIAAFMRSAPTVSPGEPTEAASHPARSMDR